MGFTEDQTVDLAVQSLILPTELFPMSQNFIRITEIARVDSGFHSSLERRYHIPNICSFSCKSYLTCDFGEGLESKLRGIY